MQGHYGIRWNHIFTIYIAFNFGIIGKIFSSLCNVCVFVLFPFQGSEVLGWIGLQFDTNKPM